MKYDFVDADIDVDVELQHLILIATLNSFNFYILLCRYEIIK